MNYTIVAYPNGTRTVVAVSHGLNAQYEALVGIAAARAGVYPGAEAQGIVEHAQVIAQVRDEYVDVERHIDTRYGRYGKVIGGTVEVIATVGPEGVV